MPDYLPPTSGMSALPALTRALLRYRHAAVRDLAWVMASPPLLGSADGQIGESGLGGVVTAAWCQARFTDAQAWLAALDSAPQGLLAWLDARTSRRLGLYFEALLGYWLAHGPGMALEAERMQVRRAGITLGEFDFVFRDARRAGRVHWEAAIKLYMHYPPGRAGEYWLGPNARDSLEHKLTRLRTHQLPLGRHAEAAALLRALPGSQGHTVAGEGLSAEAFLKGYLFYPVSPTGTEGESAAVFTQAAAPMSHGAPQSAQADAGGVKAGGVRQGLAPAHLRGWWLRAGECDPPSHDAASRWCIVDRLRWLAPVLLEPGQGTGALLTLAQLCTRIAETALCQTGADQTRAGRSMLLAELLPLEDGRWVERARGFVVPPRWPAMG